MVYPVTVDALHTVFSPYGFVQKIAIFEKGGQHQVPPSPRTSPPPPSQYQSDVTCLYFDDWHTVLSVDSYVVSLKSRQDAGCWLFTFASCDATFCRHGIEDSVTKEWRQSSSQQTYETVSNNL